MLGNGAAAWARAACPDHGESDVGWLGMRCPAAHTAVLTGITSAQRTSTEVP